MFTTHTRRVPAAKYNLIVKERKQLISQLIKRRPKELQVSNKSFLILNTILPGKKWLGVKIKYTQFIAMTHRSECVQQVRWKKRWNAFQSAHDFLFGFLLVNGIHTQITYTQRKNSWTVKKLRNSTLPNLYKKISIFLPVFYSDSWRHTFGDPVSFSFLSFVKWELFSEGRLVAGKYQVWTCKKQNKIFFYLCFPFLSMCKTSQWDFLFLSFWLTF